MWEQPWIWAAIGTIFTIETACIGCVIWIVNQLNTARTTADSAQASAHAASIALSAERVERDRLADQLTGFRLEVAKEYVSHKNLDALEKRVIGAVEHLSQRVDALINAKS